MASYDTLSQALESLRQRGYTTDFNIAFDAIACSATGKCLQSNDFEITEHHRFEGETDPGDESVVYAIQAKDGSLKGVLVNAYGMYSDETSDAIINKLTIKE